jgi:hypothetical protein
MSEIRADKLHNASGDNDSGIDLSTNDQVIIKTANTTAVTVDSSQQVGIGTSSPTSSSGGKLLAIETTADEHTNVVFNTANTDKNGIIEARRTGRSGAERFAQLNLQNNSDNGEMRFYTAPSGSDISERMRINDKGLLINTTSTLHSGVERSLEVENHSGNGFVAIFKGNTAGNETVAIHNSDTSGTRILLAFKTSGGTGTLVGRVTSDGSTTTYATSSDHRLKENVEDMTGAIDRVKQLLPKRFNFINDDTNTLVDGFLAHEAQSVVAEAVTGTHNEVDDDGNAVMQGIDQSKLVPLLTGALKEAIAKIEALETRIEALENA